MSVDRYTKNPILTRKNVSFRVNSIFNAGAIKIGNEYILLCRVEMPTGRSSFVLARSENGYEFQVDDQPCLTPENHDDLFEYVSYGIEDARIHLINEKLTVRPAAHSVEKCGLTAVRI